MAKQYYTVKKMSEISGITIRTLHYYEEVNLLAPSYYGDNGYRYYEEKELLRLQQILFFKQLGLSIKQIGKVLGRSDFDQLAALHSHKQSLLKEWNKISLLLKTVDKTIDHLQGKKTMKDYEIFEGFTIVKKSTPFETYHEAEVIVLKSVKNPKELDESEREKLTSQAHAIYRELVRCIEKGAHPDSQEVQTIISKHHAYTDEIHRSTKAVYRALAELYIKHPAFEQQLEAFHEQLAPFMSKAMLIYAEKNLK